MFWGCSVKYIHHCIAQFCFYYRSFLSIVWQRFQHMLTRGEPLSGQYIRQIVQYAVHKQEKRILFCWSSFWITYTYYDAALTRSIMIRYCRNSRRLSSRGWIHKTHPITCPSFLIFCIKLTAIYVIFILMLCGVELLALRQSNYCPIDGKVNLKEMDIINVYQTTKLTKTELSSYDAL